MDVELTNKIVKFIEENGGKSTSSETAEHLKMDKKFISCVMLKLQHNWRILESLGMNGKSRVFGIRRE